MSCVNPLFQVVDGVLQYKKCSKATEWTDILDLASEIPALLPGQYNLRGDQRFADEFTPGIGTFIRLFNLSQPYGGVAGTSPPAIGDYFYTDCMVENGDYLLHVLGLKASSYGQVDWRIDGTSALTIDYYNAATLYGQYFVSSQFTIVKSGAYARLSCHVTGKHASSSGYNNLFTKAWLQFIA